MFATLHLAELTLAGCDLVLTATQECSGFSSGVFGQLCVDVSLKVNLYGSLGPRDYMPS